MKRYVPEWIVKKNKTALKKVLIEIQGNTGKPLIKSIWQSTVFKNNL